MSTSPSSSATPTTGNTYPADPVSSSHGFGISNPPLPSDPIIAAHREYFGKQYPWAHDYPSWHALSAGTATQEQIELLVDDVRVSSQNYRFEYKRAMRRIKKEEMLTENGRNAMRNAFALDPEIVRKYDRLPRRTAANNLRHRKLIDLLEEAVELLPKDDQEADNAAKSDARRGLIILGDEVVDA